MGTSNLFCISVFLLIPLFVSLFTSPFLSFILLRFLSVNISYTFRSDTADELKCTPLTCSVTIWQPTVQCCCVCSTEHAGGDTNTDRRNGFHLHLHLHRASTSRLRSLQYHHIVAVVKTSCPLVPKAVHVMNCLMAVCCSSMPSVCRSCALNIHAVVAPRLGPNTAGIIKTNVITTWQ